MHSSFSFSDIAGPKRTHYELTTALELHCHHVWLPSIGHWIMELESNSRDLAVWLSTRNGIDDSKQIPASKMQLERILSLHPSFVCNRSIHLVIHHARCSRYAFTRRSTPTTCRRGSTLALAAATRLPSTLPTRASSTCRSSPAAHRRCLSPASFHSLSPPPPSLLETFHHYE